jgi:molecular chaperone GrpE
MSEERRGASAGQEDAESTVKVVDRRRFRPDGEAIEGGASVEPPAVEPVAAEAGGGAQPVADPRDAQLATQAARIDELTRAYASLVDDNRAFRQRMEREKARVMEAERASVAQALLETSDDLERALAAVRSAEVPPPLLEGVRLSLAALHKRISELGAERIPVAGQPFDPHVAEAVDTVAVGDAAQDGLVIQEVRPGYRIGERILRPARVRVGRIAQA